MLATAATELSMTMKSDKGQSKARGVADRQPDTHEAETAATSLVAAVMQSLY